MTLSNISAVKSKFEIPDYKAPFFLRNGHLNTIVGSYMTTTDDAVQGSREIVTYTDGNTTSVYVHEHQSDWVVLSFHGLGGNVSSDFISRAVQAANRNKVTIIAVNHRNSGDAHGFITSTLSFRKRR